jgi:L-fuculose-phosphate aldolase
MLLADARQTVAETGRRMITEKLVEGTAGNISIRVDDLVAISPTTIPYEKIEATDVCVVDLEGNVVESDGRRRPSSEVPMHLSIYRNTEARAIVHHHGLRSAALSTVFDVVPAIHYYTVQLGGALRVADYACFGSDRLAETVLRALENRNAALMQNHGAVAYGDTLEQAYQRARLVEWLCAMYIDAASVGTPRQLTDAELDEVNQARASRIHA